MNIIPLKNSTVVALVDDEDYDDLIQFEWFEHNKGYVVRYFKASYEFMHTRVLKNQSALLADHINGNKWDNQKHNLRLVTKSDNNQNQNIRKDSTTGLKGVTYNQRIGKYQSKIQVNGVRIHAGTFETAQQAADAYDVLAIKHFGPDAQTNKKIQERKAELDQLNHSKLNLTTRESSPSLASPNLN